MKLLFILLFSFSSFHCIAQENDSIDFQMPEYPYRPPYNVTNSFGPSIAYRGFGNHFLEAGISYLGMSHGFIGADLTYLSNLKKEEERLDGYSFTYFWGFAFFEPGINTTVFTDYNNTDVYLRPHFGLGLGGWTSFSYGYNIPIYRRLEDPEINRHEFKLIIRIGLLFL